MTLKDLIRKKVFQTSDLATVDSPDESRLTFINNSDAIMRMKLKEYNVWYEGDGDELLNFYTRANTIEYNYEPFYDRNKRNYFWAISSTENDIKRTHSGQPRNIVDTLCGIVKFPLISAGSIGSDKNRVQKNLDNIIKESNLEEVFKQEQLPLSLVEGWGCYKINYDLDESDYPVAVYYKAENVDFIYKRNKIVGIIFRDYYAGVDEKQYMLCEVRRLQVKRDDKTGLRNRYLIIEKTLYRVVGENDLIEVSFKEVPELEGTIDYVEIGPTNMLLAVPCILYKSNSKGSEYGRSIFTGKIDLFDDLDQCLSQSSNAVRKSTPIEYFNSEYLERGEDGLPKEPKAYDRKYSVYNGARDMNGAVQGNPVEVTQPQLNLDQYGAEEQRIILQIINGIMSPATLGMDIAKKDNAAAQREKEKVTIFTRNGIIDTEKLILKDLFNQLLATYEFMHSGQITVTDYDISIKFSEFASASFEDKLETLIMALDSQAISVDMYLQKLYDGALSDKEYKREHQFVTKYNVKPRADGMKGIAGGGKNAEGLLDNMTGGFGDD